MIDEEGGRVSRLKNIIDNSIFPENILVICTKERINLNFITNLYVDQISYLLNLIELI